MRYKVHLAAVASIYRTVVVEAKDEEEAEKKAIKAGHKDLAYPDGTSWELNGILNCPEKVSTDIEATDVEEYDEDGDEE